MPETFPTSHIDFVNVSTVATFGDRSFNQGLEPALLALSKQCKIKYVLLPYSFSNGPESAVWHRDDTYIEMNPSTCVQKNLFKSKFKNRHFKFYQDGEYLALRDLGVLSSNPWVHGCGLSTKVLVATPIIKDAYKEFGLKKEKVIVTGQPDFDTLFKGQQPPVLDSK